MYTRRPRCLYPEVILRGILSGQYPSCLHIPYAPKCEVPLGFCLVAFPPPPVTDPATRLSIFRRERLSTFRLIIPDRRRPFLSERLGLALRLGLSKPFGFSSERIERRLSAPSVRGRRVTTFAPPLGAGRGPVGDLDCDVIIHPYFGESSRMYFNYYPYFTGLRVRSGGKLGGKICGYIVDELWEIGGGSMSIGPRSRV